VVRRDPGCEREGTFSKTFPSRHLLRFSTGADAILFERQVTVMKNAKLVFVLVVFLTGFVGAAESRAEAAGSPRVNIKNTFDYGTLVEYLVTIPEISPDLSMVFSQRRKSEGSDDITDAYLKYRFESSPDRPMVSADRRKSFFIGVMEALHERFGSDLKVRSLSSHEYLGTKETETKAILAFKDFTDWKRYLKDHNAFVQWETYAIVVQRWKEKGVFSDLVDTFKELGYACQVTGFEKLFVSKAGERPIYPDLKALGIKPDERFPYPGVVHFELKRIQRDGGSDA